MNMHKMYNNVEIDINKTYFSSQIYYEGGHNDVKRSLQCGYYWYWS
jgi:hypothetical protein